MPRIDRLTPEQEAALPLWRARYLERGTATGPCDRQAIEAAVAKLYESRGYAPPRLVIWMDSPLGGMYAAAVLAGIEPKRGQLRDQLWGQLGGQLGDQLWGQLWGQLRGQLWGQLRDQLGGQLWGQLRGQLWGQLRGQLGGQLRGQLRGQLWGQLWDHLWGQLGDQLGGQLWGQLYRAGYGQHDGHWIGWLTFGRHIGAKLEPAGGLDALDVLCDAGWWWPFEGAVVLTDRPTVLERDERGRLHSETGPAMAYADGYDLWAWHGTRVDREVITTPVEAITAERITGERNAEVRRVLTERVGAERYVRLMGAERVATDDWGTLWRAERAGDEPMLVVELVNSTPEPDGHSKIYWFRVPGTAEREDPDRCLACGSSIAIVPETPHQAVAWGYGLCAADYAPAVMT